MNLTVSCLCGASRQELTSRRPRLLPSDAEIDRRSSGVLFISRLAVDPPEQRKLSELSAYESDDGTRLFCGVCGCHVFHNFAVSPTSTALAQNVGDVQPPAGSFAVATGAIIESPDQQEGTDSGVSQVDDTRDGGLGPWLPMAEMKGRTRVPETGSSKESAYNSVPAACGCGNVKLLLQRPRGLAQLPYSPYPDLMFPYKTTPMEKLDNPSDEKWYLRGTGEGARYLAGTCACKSCRLSTGYEIQTWAFIPRLAISISVPPDAAATGSAPNTDAKYTTKHAQSYIPLDFKVLESLPAGQNPLRSYESSPGVFREFCQGCGATVFWHSEKRSDLIDVSVGLLQAKEGARAESLLEWWRDRCSFAEDAGLDRKGWVRTWAEDLVQGLEEGIKK